MILTITSIQQGSFEGILEYPTVKPPFKAKIKGNIKDGRNIEMKEIDAREGAGRFVGEISHDGLVIKGVRRSYDGKQFKWIAEKKK